MKLLYSIADAVIEECGLNSGVPFTIVHFNLEPLNSILAAEILTY